MSLHHNDIKGLEDLLEQSEQFTQDIFDWVAPLNQRHMLGQMYDFRTAIESKIAQLKQEARREEAA